jgi:hypothetical protein
MAGLFGLVRSIWRALAPEPQEVEPVVSVLDDGRAEFAWRGPALVVDRRRGALMRDGRVLAGLARIRAVEIVHLRADDERPESWRVDLDIGASTDISLGSTKIDVEASIAAARLATLLDVEVRSR